MFLRSRERFFFNTLQRFLWIASYYKQILWHAYRNKRWERVDSKWKRDHWTRDQPNRFTFRMDSATVVTRGTTLAQNYVLFTKNPQFWYLEKSTNFDLENLRSTRGHWSASRLAWLSRGSLPGEAGRGVETEKTPALPLKGAPSLRSRRARRGWSGKGRASRV